MNVHLRSKNIDAVIPLVKDGIGSKLELASNHWRKVQDLKDGGGLDYIGEEGVRLQRRTICSVEDIQDQIVQYAKKEMDQKQILALIIFICKLEPDIKDSSLYFLHARPLVELLKTIKSPYYRGALLIYQAALFDGRNKDEVLTCLFDLPTVSVGEADRYHAMSVFFKGSAYESIKNYIKASDVLSEIGPDDPMVDQKTATELITAFKTLVEKQKEEEGCVIF